MLVTDARRAARVGRTAWRSSWPTRTARSGTRAAIEEGRALLDRALALGGGGPYAVQAAIAALHVDDPPDWAQVAALYAELARLTGSPVVELNRAAALAEAGDPAAGLALADGLALEQYPYLHATRAELLHRLGRAGEARSAYERALDLTVSEPERRFLERRLAALGTA